MCNWTTANDEILTWKPNQIVCSCCSVIVSSSRTIETGLLAFTLIFISWLFYSLLSDKCVQSSICIANWLISYSIIMNSTWLTYWYFVINQSWFNWLVHYLRKIPIIFVVNHFMFFHPWIWSIFGILSKSRKIEVLTIRERKCQINSTLINQHIKN